VSVPGKSNEKEKTENESGEELKVEEKEGEKEHKSEIAVDEACWIYEQLRRLAQDLSHPLITMLQQECTRASCPEMKAGEWLYLCVAHGNDGAMEQCCAIDYILHTLDSATALLNSPRAFPSRLSIPQASHRHFSSLARRLGRIFAHAYFHHREAFEQAEVESSLYARFLALTSKFDLVPSEFLVIPNPPSDGSGRGRDIEVEPPRLLAASVDHQRGMQQNHKQDHQQVEPGGDLGVGEWEKASERGKSPPGLSGGVSPRGDQSPRKYGRNRTDTMVFSEAFNVAEELTKGIEGELDGDHEENSAQSDDGTTGHEVLTSEPEIIIDELEASIIGAAVPPTEKYIPDSHHDSIEPSHYADEPKAPADASAESVTETPSSDAPVEVTSEPEASAVPTLTEDSASDTAAEEVNTHQAEVEEAQKAEPEHVAEGLPSISSHSSESKTPDVADSPATDMAPTSEDPVMEVENSETLIVADKPEVADEADVADEGEAPLSKDTIHSVSEHEAHSEPATEQTAEVSPEALSEEEMEEEPSS
ncbi:hypothetical protein PILCRDRAFT_826518, partial [Piloderma croceum F 1598]